MTVPGADVAIAARFEDNWYGILRERLRLVVLAAGAVAIVDVDPDGAESWQVYWPGVLTMLQTLRVVARPAPRALQRAATPASLAVDGVPGLYSATVLQFHPMIGGSPGTNQWLVGTRFYLLSANGQVYRAYRLPTATSGDIRRFDFERAPWEDPDNTGTYTVQGTQVTILISRETITATRTDADTLEIYESKYGRVRF